MIFRERDGVNISYLVMGRPESEQFPYVHDIPSLKEAVAIGRHYPGIHHDGAATHIMRTYAKKFPDGHKYHHSTKTTHEWRVDSDGRLSPEKFFQRSWPTTRLDITKYVGRLPVLTYKANTLQGQLLDLALIASYIGLTKASKALYEHVYGRSSIPSFSLLAPVVASENLTDRRGIFGEVAHAD